MTRAASFDHLVGAGKHCAWNCETKCLGGFQVYDQLVLGRRLAVQQKDNSFVVLGHLRDKALRNFRQSAVTTHPCEHNRSLRIDTKDRPHTDSQ